MIMNQQSAAQKKVASLYEDVCRRAGASPFGSCPVELTGAFVKLCLAQSCGKCVPCRVGLDRLYALIEKILEKNATAEDLKTLESCANTIYDSADCAIGFEAAKLVKEALVAFRDDFESHIEKGICTEHFGSIPCSSGCPAHVDIPGYIACIGAGRYADAVRVIRHDNPFPAVCGLICEHPCEKYCRRNVVDDAVNIRGLKRFAVENAGNVPAPAPAKSNGKSVAVLGGGPAGLTAAYFLRLKGFEVTVFEKRPKLGGMLRYGIPVYRLPDAELDADIDVILSTGINVKLNTNIGTDITFEEIRSEFDAVYISIGAHRAKKLRVEGEDAEGVLSAVELLGAVGEGKRPDFSGKRVCVIGGGNVAMDVTRTSRRLGASSVTCVYRRREVDMTALPEEIAGAKAEDCEIMQLMSPVKIETFDGKVTGLTVKPQLSGPVRDGRPAPVDSTAPAETIPCDIVIIAIGQDIDSKKFAEYGIDLNRGAFVAKASGEVKASGSILEGVFTGGDCYTGPATVIKAIDAGKVAAANIDKYFGFCTPIVNEVEIPEAYPDSKLHWGRVNTSERTAEERKDDFDLFEKCMTDEEAKSECSRCLRCDHYGCASFKGGRVTKW